MFSRLGFAARSAARMGARQVRANRGAGFRVAVAVAASGLGASMLGANMLTGQTFCAPTSSNLNAPGMVKNTAFVFLKPHANTEAARQLVAEGLAAQGVNVVSDGEITSEEINEKMLVDNHYYAIASKATLLKPNQLNVPAAKFQAKFGLGWKEALEQGVVFNAKDACTELGLDAAGLNKHWAAAKKAKKLIKFGGGFYCGLVEVPGKKPVYVFNGFFMSMRNKYVAPGKSIHYYVVEWDSKKLSWDDFRGQVLGPTDPADAPKDSLRGRIMTGWKGLGLASEPNVGDNGVHASASPFEALAERMNWLGQDLEQDDFGKAMLAAGITKSTIKDWSVDPQVSFGAKNMPIRQSLFDSLEDTDSDMCLARSLMIAQGPMTL
eukprot:CAMPEP_0205821022 /NCGR_PEP_ID=MMETSP0206-20130828/4539_1 /ASSEMBLY_ACC=CAM_ASM_000279 /TAXON_ID=36767 /ORGANISM="Euplotes focardii, Strain TN1" /LENGTH=378 /DNA_ID=CAMNT_0053116193 /DNA_START=29 /DNA_END=1165 /DNA_ORIENTATION=+